MQLHRTSRDETQAHYPQPRSRGAFTKVPTNLLGRLLDHGKASAHAIRGLAIKLREGGRVLNAKTCRRDYGMSDREFRSSIQLLTATGILDRWQHGRRTYADEKPAAAGPHHVELLDTLLGSPMPEKEEDRKAWSKTQRSVADLLAFIVVVKLSPDAMTPAEAAARFGITGHNAVERLRREAEATGEIVVRRGSHGRIKIARDAAIFSQVVENDTAQLAENDTATDQVAENDAAKGVDQVAENDTAQNDTAENDTAPRRRKAPKQMEESQADGKRGRYATRERAGSADHGSSGSETEQITLRDWRKARFFTGREQRDEITEGGEPAWQFGGQVKVVMSFPKWLERLQHHGGAPDHIERPEAHWQALEIAHEVSAISGADPWLVMNAIASRIAEAHKAGKVIASLGFIAESLIRAAEDDKDDDFVWLYDLPVRIPKAEFVAATDLAQRAIAAFEGAKADIDRRALLSTYRVEELAGMIAEHGSAVEAGIAAALRQRTWGEGAITTWRRFEQHVAAARARAQQAAAEQVQSQRSRDVPETEYREAQKLAEMEAKALGDNCIAINRESLMSTPEVEALAAMIEDYSWDDVVGAVNHTIDRKKRTGTLAPDLPDNERICGWRWFERVINDAIREELAALGAARAAADKAELEPVRAAAVTAMAALKAAGFKVECQLLWRPQLTDLMHRLDCNPDKRRSRERLGLDPSGVLHRAIALFVANPGGRTKVSNWSNIGEPIRAAVREAMADAAMRKSSAGSKP